MILAKIPQFLQVYSAILGGVFEREYNLNFSLSDEWDLIMARTSSDTTKLRILAAAASSHSQSALSELKVFCQL